MKCFLFLFGCVQFMVFSYRETFFAAITRLFFVFHKTLKTGILLPCPMEVLAFCKKSSLT